MGNIRVTNVYYTYNYSYIIEFVHVLELAIHRLGLLYTRTNYSLCLPFPLPVCHTLSSLTLFALFLLLLLAPNCSLQFCCCCFAVVPARLVLSADSVCKDNIFFVIRVFII